MIAPDILKAALAAGVMVALEASSGAEAARSEIEAAGDAGKAFREFALGFNPLLAIPTAGERWIPYYGYGAGVVRLSLGDNTELVAFLLKDPSARVRRDARCPTRPG